MFARPDDRVGPSTVIMAEAPHHRGLVVGGLEWDFAHIDCEGQFLYHAAGVTGMRYRTTSPRKSRVWENKGETLRD